MAGDGPDFPDPEEDNKELAVADRSNRIKSAVSMRIYGASYQEIADVLGYQDWRSARNAVERGLADSAGEDTIKQMRFLNRRRLERLLRPSMAKAMKENDPDQQTASRTALAIVDRLIKLDGVDAPTQVVVHSPTDAAIERYVHSVRIVLQDSLPEEADIVDADIVEDRPELAREDSGSSG